MASGWGDRERWRRMLYPHTIPHQRYSLSDSEFAMSVSNHDYSLSPHHFFIFGWAPSICGRAPLRLYSGLYTYPEKSKEPMYISTPLAMFKKAPIDSPGRGRAEIALCRPAAARRGVLLPRRFLFSRFCVAPVFGLGRFAFADGALFI